MSENLVLNDRYELLREYNRGGMSIVHLAADKALDGKIWAVKQVRQNTGVDLSAFRREIEMLSQLNHSDIPRIVDRIEYNGSYYVVMDFIDGVSMSKKIQRDGTQPEDVIVAWAKQLCGVLKYLHTTKDQPIIYLDFKPENVILVESGGYGNLKLIDFGVAKIVPRGSVSSDMSFGTKGYAAPEQYANGSKLFDERTDIYGFGATLYYMATGQTPGLPPKAIGSIRDINPMYSDGLDYIIRKCTQDDPDKRYNNCDEILNDLDNIANFTENHRNEMRKRISVFVTLLALSVVCLGLFLFGWRMDAAQNATDAFNAKQMGMSYEAQASTYEMQNNFDAADDARDKAAKAFIDSIEKDETSDPYVYLHLFNMLLPRNAKDDYTAKTQMAIDVMRPYVETSSSPVYHDATILYQLAKKCLEVGQSSQIYAQYAVDYFGVIVESEEYKNGTLNSYEIDEWKVIAETVLTDSVGASSAELAETLENLENSLNKSDVSVNDRLNSYYTIMLLYSRYSHALSDSQEHILSLGEKARTILDSLVYAQEDDAITFNSAYPMYELVAVSCYEAAVLNTDVNNYEERLENFYKSLEWYGYAQSATIEIDTETKVKIANIWRSIYETNYNANITEGAKELLDNASKLYEEVIAAAEDNIPAQIYLGIVRVYQYRHWEEIGLDMQAAFNAAKTQYETVRDMMIRTTGASTSDMSKFNALETLYNTYVGETEQEGE